MIKFGTGQVVGTHAADNDEGTLRRIASQDDVESTADLLTEGETEGE
jgi:hypothetical protein